MTFDTRYLCIHVTEIPCTEIGFTVLAAILAVGPYYLLAARWQKSGVGTVLSLLVVLFCLVTGEATGFLSKAIIFGFGILICNKGMKKSASLLA